jgi:nucleoid DNA-binding protein
METQFLKELIENNARVILPEFGAFLVKDDGTGVFKPQNVTFSPFLRYNDGMVEDALATKSKISKDQAKEQLSNFVEMMKSELQSNKTFAISGLGSLLIDSRGSIQFSTSQTPSKPASVKTSTKPSETPKPESKTKPANSEADNPKEERAKPQEPKPKVHSEPAAKPEKQPVVKVNEPKPKVEETVSPSPKPEETKKVIPADPQPAKTKPITPTVQKKSSNGGTGKAILIGTLIGIGFVVVAASGWYLYSKGLFSSGKNSEGSQTVERVSPPQNEPQQEETKGKFEDEFEKLSAEMDQTTQEATPKANSQPQQKKISKTQPNTEPKLSLPVTQEGMFHIVAGSFRNADYAEKFSSDMQSSGYNSKVLVQPTGMHAVTLGSFLTRQQAVDSMNVWKQKNPNIWILNQ